MKSLPDAFAPLAAGHRLGKFEIITLLSSGGQAQVYLARVSKVGLMSPARVLRHIRWLGATPAFIEEQQLCTIKLPLPRWVENLRDEHTYLLNPEVRHPHLVQMLPDQGTTTGERRKLPKGLWFTTLMDSNGASIELPYIALTYEPGGSLKDLLERRKYRPLPPATAIVIALQIAAALNHLHVRCKLVHHDVSPSNIVFRQPLSVIQPRTLTCVLIDLAAADSPRTPRLRHIYGKRIYLAPERRSKPPRPIDWPVDVYGLGITLYEMLVGRLPNTGTTSSNDLISRLPHIRTLQPALSEPLAALVMQAVEHDPARRPTLPDCIQRLQATPEADQPSALRGSLSTSARWQLAASALVAIMLVVVTAFTLAAVLGGDVRGATALPTSTPGVPTITPFPTQTPSPSATPIIPTSTPALFAPTSTP